MSFWRTDEKARLAREEGFRLSGVGKDKRANAGRTLQTRISFDFGGQVWNERVL
jgi:hypothetical protein